MQDQLLAATLLNKEEGYKKILEQEIATRSKMEEEMNSKIKDLEHKLVHLESRMRQILPPPAASAAKALPPPAIPLYSRARDGAELLLPPTGIVITLSTGGQAKVYHSPTRP